VDVAAKRVLVVDDDEDTREIVVECLRSEGEMDGRELLTSARALLGSSMPPFVFVTGVGASARLGVAEQVLTKPYGLDELLTVVGHHVRA
jgi:CheY-like chemotaxis protein